MYCTCSVEQPQGVGFSSDHNRDCIVIEDLKTHRIILMPFCKDIPPNIPRMPFELCIELCRQVKGGGGWLLLTVGTYSEGNLLVV